MAAPAPWASIQTAGAACSYVTDIDEFPRILFDASRPTGFGKDDIVDLEFHQLDLCYAKIRTRAPEREKKLVASIAELGQLVPVVVVLGKEAPLRYVVIDGFKRIRALRQLKTDTVRATQWDLEELSALLLNRSLRSADGDSILEQAWLIDELRVRFGLTMVELSQRFDRSQSWISRRLAVVGELPGEVQKLIQAGRIAAHAATKYLVPMARAKRDHCERMARAIAKHQLSTRDVGELYAGWRDGSVEVRENLLADPLLFLRAKRVAEEEAPAAESPQEGLIRDVATISAVAGRARKRVREGAAAGLSPLDIEGLAGGLRLARSAILALVDAIKGLQGDDHARPEHPRGHPGAEEAGTVGSEDCASAQGVPASGDERHCLGVR